MIDGRIRSLVRKQRKHMSEIALASGHNEAKNNGRFKYEIFLINYVNEIFKN